MRGHAILLFCDWESGQLTARWRRLDGAGNSAGIECLVELRRCRRYTGGLGCTGGSLVARRNKISTKKVDLKTIAPPWPLSLTVSSIRAGKGVFSAMKLGKIKLNKDDHRKGGKRRLKDSRQPLVSKLESQISSHKHNWLIFFRWASDPGHGGPGQEGDATCWLSGTWHGFSGLCHRRHHQRLQQKVEQFFQQIKWRAILQEAICLWLHLWTENKLLPISFNPL